MFLGNFGFDTDFSNRIVGPDFCPQQNVQCECKELNSCPWATKRVQKIKTLPRNHPIKKKFIRFILKRSCGGSKYAEKVYCCNNKVGFPSNCLLKDLKTASIDEKENEVTKEGNSDVSKNTQIVQKDDLRGGTVVDIEVSCTIHEMISIPCTLQIY